MGVDPYNDKGVILFGRDISKIPCFRNTFLYSISGGIGCGLMFFLFTSRIKASTDFAMASFCVITMSYWVYCRYNYSKTRFEMQRIQELLRRKALYEGTDKDVTDKSDPVDA